MRNIARILGVACLIGLATGPASRAGVTFNFVFDNNGPGPPPATPPFVGSGTLTIADDPGQGTFTLTSLGEYHIAFSIGGDLYTEADIRTTLATVEVVIADNGLGSEGVQFSNVNSFGDGPLSGSVDFSNAAGQSLSFEPPIAGSLNLYYETGQGSFGNYTGATPAIAATEPSTLLAGLIAAIGVFAWGRRMC